MQKSVVIIAEAGVNHNGDSEMLEQLIDVAAASGADYIKFQTFKTDALVRRDAAKADYQVANTKPEETQFDMLKRLELSFDDFRRAKELCFKYGIGFASTAFDLESISFLKELEMDFWKIPSGELTNYPYLMKIAQMGRPVLMSTGMATMVEIEQALNTLEINGLQRDKVTILHCHTAYPTDFEDVHLRAMATIQQTFGTEVGYSDHTSGVTVPVAAVALGASVIEKHFTLDKSLPGPDHSASLDPAELRAMVSSIRELELAMGKSEKLPSEREMSNRHAARKGLYWAEDYFVGMIIKQEHMLVQRPESESSPMLIPKLVGRTLKCMVRAGTPVLESQFDS